MKKKTFTTRLLTICAVSLALLVPAASFAAEPSAYDGKSYESMGYTSDDPDGEFNLAVIAKGDVKIGGTMRIEGSIYSCGTIYARNGGDNIVDGLFISGTKNDTQYFEGGWYQDENGQWVKGEPTKLDGYYMLEQYGDSLVADEISQWAAKPQYAGAILDTETSFECTYEDYTVPEVANNLGDVDMNVYIVDSPKTITEDTHIGTLTMNGTQGNGQNIDAALTVDTTNGDVNIVIDKLGSINNPSIKVIGNHKANIYIMDASYINNLFVNYNESTLAAMGNSANTNIYVKSDSKVTFDNGYIMANTITVDAPELQVSGSGKVFADINSNAAIFTLTGGSTEVTGTVCVPAAASNVTGSGTLYGQIHTDTLDINGAGSIVYKADAAVGKAEVEPPAEEDPAEEPPVEEDPAEEDPVEEPTVEKDDAVCVKFDVRTGEFTPGMMESAPLRPHDDRFGDNDNLVLPGFEDVYYTVLIEDTFEARDENVPQYLMDAAECVAENAQARLNELEYSWETVQFGRIDSQAWNKDEYVNRNGQSTLLITPFINAELDANGVDHNEFMWLGIGDRNGNLLYVYVMDRNMAGIENLIDGE